MSKLSAINSEITKLRAAAEGIEATATAEGRDLTADEAQTAEDLLNRAADLRPQLDREIALEDSLNRAASVTARFATPAVEAQDMTAGEFLASAFKMQNGLISKDEHFARSAKYRAQQVVADGGTTVPSPITGSLIEFFNADRPVWNSFTAEAMPAEGKSFLRPEVTQQVATGDQASEFATVTSQKMTLTTSTVTKFTEAGYLDISQQDIDWTSPSALDQAVASFVKAFSYRLETRASAYLLATASASAAWTATNVSTIVNSVIGGVSSVFARNKAVPNTLWLDFATAMTLAGTFNTNTDVTAMQALRMALSEAGVPLNVVVGPQLSANTRIVGDSSRIESYLDVRGLLQVAQPDVLGQRIAYSGYGAMFGKSEGFCKLV
jgi:hypothetical protein